MKQSIHPTLAFVQNRRFAALLALLMLGLAAAVPRAAANSVPFSHLFVFGDSLSDTGNYYRLSGGVPPPLSFNGRFCNGPLWVEYLAAGLGMDNEPLDNFAIAGATTGTFNSNDSPGKEYPGLLDEIASFQSQSALSEPAQALFVIGAGANDFFVGLRTGTSPAVLIRNGVNNTVAAVQQLWGSGARHILVMNLPDLGVTPSALSTGMGAILTQLNAAYDQVLEVALENLAQAGIVTIRLDAFTVLAEMANKPEAFGFANVTTPLSMAPPGVNPDQFLFWDPVHPTTIAHQVLAHEATEQLISTFSPSNGQSAPDSRVNGLNGLVNAAHHNN